MSIVSNPYTPLIEALGFRIRLSVADDGTQEFRFFRQETTDYHRIGCLKILPAEEGRNPQQMWQHYRRMLRFLETRLAQAKKTT